MSAQGERAYTSYATSYYCTVVSGQKGCCPNGKICTSIGGCPTSGYVPCAGYDFCCRAYSHPHLLLSRLLKVAGFSPFVRIASGDTCYRDSANNPKCSPDTTYTLTSTSTSYSTYSIPSIYSTPSTYSTPLTYSTPSNTTTPRPTSTSNGSNGDFPSTPNAVSNG